MRQAKRKNSVRVPACIAVVMDGNRRWAKKRSRSPLEGHLAGRRKLKDAVRWSKEFGISYLIAYGFSTENWKRSPREVAYLMDLLYDSFVSEFASFKKEGIRIIVIGERAMLSEKLRSAIEKAEAETQGARGMTLVLAVSYGGRSEIVNAANRACRSESAPRHTEKSFERLLYTRDIPDPDLLIRTGGERRLSNFLSWQTAYTELWFTGTLWPAFQKRQFQKALADFSLRERRRGGDAPAS